MSGIVSQNVGRPSGLVKAADAGGGAWTLIETLTSDGSDATMDFTSGIDSTYPIYVFKFLNIHPETESGGVEFQFNLSVDGGSNYNVTKTSSSFYAFHTEADDDTTFAYDPAEDLPQSTAFQALTPSVGNDNDQNSSGELWLFKPSSTTFVKHYFATSNLNNVSDVQYNWRIAGYGNTTSAVDAIRFQMSTDEIQGGKIKMYGIKDS